MRIPTMMFIIASMRRTFEDRVAAHGEYPVLVAAAPMPEGYKLALEAQRKAKETT